MNKIKIVISTSLCILIISLLLYFVLDKKTDKDVSLDANIVVSYYNNPIIPKGFKKIETDTASWTLNQDGTPFGWDSGLVIQDNIGNEFVWVPVQEINYEDKLPDWLYISELKEPNEILRKQIETYGGFYIARYEAGVSDTMQNNITNISSTTNNIQYVPVSKKGRLPWNYITLKNAKHNAQSMYKNSSDISSDLMTVYHWLYITKWFIQSGYNLDNTNKFGNFVDSTFEFTGYYCIDYNKDYEYTSYEFAENKMKQTYNMILSTGASETTKTNNIYDLLGNLIEYTDTYNEYMGYYSVGGYFSQLSSKWAFNPSNIGDKTPLEKLGFRVVLYLK